MPRLALPALGSTVAVLSALSACAPDPTAVAGPSPVRRNVAPVNVTAAIQSGPGAVCLDIPSGNTAPGVRPQLYQCIASNANQQFVWQVDGRVTPVSAASVCLSVVGQSGADGAAVDLEACTGASTQQWRLTGDGQIVNANGKCLDVPYGTRTNGALVQIWTCGAGNANQQWSSRFATGTATTYVAALPRLFVDITYPAAPTRSIRVVTGSAAALQAALDTARGGDEIVLPADSIYTGNFVLRARAGSGTVVLRTDTPLPAAGTRATPAAAAHFAKIVGGSAAPALAAEPGAHDFRVVGIEVVARNGQSPTDANAVEYNLVNLDAADPQRGLAESTRIVLDRVYIHGQVNSNVTRCVALNGAYEAVIDSDVRDCYGTTGDTQAITAWLGSGPFLIQNNFLSGESEVVATGGGGPVVAGRVPSDIIIRRNHIYKPTTGRWVIGGPQYVPQNKNMIESKSGRRVLVEGNVFENQPRGDNSQYWPVNIKTSPYGDPAQQTADWTLRYNKYINMGAGYGFVAHEYGAVNQGTRRIVAHDELWVNMNAAGIDAFMGVSGSPPDSNAVRDVTLDHVTLVIADPTDGLSAVFRPDGTSQMVNLTLTNSVLQNGQYGTMYGDSGHFPNLTLTGNLVVVTPGVGGYANYPAGNTTVPSISMDGTGRISDADAAKATPTDGRRVGADVTAVESATAGVRSTTVP